MRIISGKARGTRLYTLDGIDTRPTLDRVKESIFNIIQNDIKDSIILDLFSGSGAIALEFISRGAKKAIICEKSKEAINIINKNIEKTHFKDYVQIYNKDFENCLKDLSGQKFDYIYLDPPYKTNYVFKALNLILDLNLIDETSKVIIETDDEERILDDLEKINIEIIDKRKYGRAYIIFVKVNANK